MSRAKRQINQSWRQRKVQDLLTSETRHSLTVLGMSSTRDFKICYEYTASVIWFLYVMDRSSAHDPTVPQGLAGICSTASGLASLLASVDDSGCPDVADASVISLPKLALLELLLD